MFKVGQRVVFVDCELPRNPDIIYPQLNEVVTIDAFVVCPAGRFFIILKEYPKPLAGFINGILYLCFRPIDETFADTILEKIKKEINEESLSEPINIKNIN